MNGHLRRCRCASGAHVRPQSPGNASYLQEPPSTLRSGAQGAQSAPVAILDGPTMSALCALHLTIPEQAPTPDDSDGLRVART